MSQNKPLSDRVSRWIRPEIQDLAAYHVPDATGLLKLDAMENPYSWDEALKQQWLEKLAVAEINRYPDPAAQSLRQKLRVAMQIPDDYGILFGNGSDELIQILAMAVAKPGAVVLAPEPSFVMYKMIAKFTSMQYVGVTLNAEFQLDIKAMLEAISQHQPALIFLAQPNNPTGKLFKQEHILQILAASDGIVVVDEAYMAFTDCNAIPLLDHFDNLLVMRTLSKVGLAGLRLGFLVGKAQWLEELDKLRLPYNINILTQVSTEFALENYELLRSQAAAIRSEREELMTKLGQYEGFTVYPSEANFILVRVGPGEAQIIFQGLKDQKILIKCLDGGHPSLKDCLRFTVGTPDDSVSLLRALDSLVAKT